MAEQVVYPLNFDASPAYNAVNRLAAYTQRKLAMASPMKASGQGMGFAAMNRDVLNFNRTLEAANNRMVAFAATSTVVYGAAKAFYSLYKNALETEKALAQIQVNVKLTSTEMRTLTADLFKAANSTGNSFYVAAEAAAEFGRQGLKVADIAKATSAALVLTQISGMDVAASVRSLTAAVNTFGKEATSYESLVNKMAAADTNFAVSSKDIAEAISRVGSTAKDAGISLDQLIAAVTSVQQTTARGGAAIGNAFKNIFTRLQRDDVAASIENLGIQTKTADGKFINQIEVLKRLAGAYDGLTDSQKANISEKLGGVYQINIVKALIGDLSKQTGIYQQALETVGRAQNEAFIKSEFLGRTAINKINEAKNSFVQLSEAIGKLGLNSAVGNLASEFSTLMQGLSTSLGKDPEMSNIGDKLGQGFIKGLVNAISGPGLAMVGMGLTKLSFSILGRVGRDLGQTYAPGSGKLVGRQAQIIQENKERLISIQEERRLNEQMMVGNRTLAERLSIMSRVSASGVTSAMTGGRIGPAAVPKSTFANTPRRFASGMIPAINREAVDIARGVGGASRNAKPVAKKIKISPNGGHETAVVNSHEVIIRNFMGGGADAVFNKDMIRQAGGLNKLNKLGKVERVHGSTANFSRGLGTRLGGGVQGAFYDLKNGVGVKRMRGESPEVIQREYAWAKLLSERKIIPGVTGPKVYGSLERSLIDKRIGKATVKGELGYEALNDTTRYNLGESIESLMRSRGIPAADLHGKNFMVNDIAKNFLNRKAVGQSLASAKQATYGDWDANGKFTKGGPEKLQKFFRRLAKVGGQVSIVDPGYFGVPVANTGARRLYDKYSKISPESLAKLHDKGVYAPKKNNSGTRGWGSVPLRQATDSLRKINLDFSWSDPNKGSKFVPNWVMKPQSPPQKPFAQFRGEDTENFHRAFREGKSWDHFKGQSLGLQKRPGRVSFANGHIPNYSLGLMNRLSTSAKRRVSPMGAGEDGAYFAFNKKGSPTGIGAKYEKLGQYGVKGNLENDYVYGRLLNEHSVMPGVTGPKIYGSYRRSMEANRVGKEYLSGDNGMSPSGAYAPRVGQAMEYYLNTVSGIKASDLHNGNFRVNRAAHDFLSQPKVKDALKMRTRDLDGTWTGAKPNYYKRIETIFKGMEGKGGKINIIDPGRFNGFHGDSPFKDTAKSIRGFAGGYIPNFAKGRSHEEWLRRERERMAKRIKRIEANKAARPVTLNSRMERARDAARLKDEQRRVQEAAKAAQTSQKRVTNRMKRRHPITYGLPFDGTTPSYTRSPGASYYPKRKIINAGAPGMLIQPPVSNARSPIPPAPGMFQNSSFAGTVTARLNAEAMAANQNARLQSGRQRGQGQILSPERFLMNKRVNVLSRNATANTYRLNPAAAREAFREKLAARSLSGQGINSNSKDYKARLAQEKSILAQQRRERNFRGASASSVTSLSQPYRQSLGNAMQAQGQEARAATPLRSEKNTMASSHFARFMGENPNASMKEIKAARHKALMDTGGKVSDKQFKETYKAAKSNRNQRHSAKVGGIGMLGVFGGSMLGEAVGSPGVGSALSSIGMGAAFGSSFGPVGTGIGALAGAAIAGASAIKKSTIKFEKLQESIGSLSSAAEKQQSALQTFFSTKETMDTLIQDPNSTKSQIQIAARQQASSLGDLSPELRSKMLATLSMGKEEGQKEMARLAGESTQKQNASVNAATALGSIVGNADKNNSSLGLFFRKLTGGASGSVDIDTAELDKSMSSFLANFDMEALKAKADGGDQNAIASLDSYKKGDFNGFLQNQRDLGIVNKSVISDTLRTTLDIKAHKLEKSFEEARDSIDATAAAIKGNEASAIGMKVAFEDFQKYVASFTRRSALKGAIGSSNNSLLSARLDMVANQPGTSEFSRQSIEYSQKVGDFNVKGQELEKELGDSVFKIFNKAYNSPDKASLEGTYGKDLISKIMSGGMEEGGAEKILDQIVDKLDIGNGFDADTKTEIRGLRTTFQVNNLELQTAKQIAKEQLKALQDINRKQQFDKLINSIRGRDSRETSYNNLELRGQIRDALNPSKKERDDDAKTWTSVRRTGNADAAYNLISKNISKYQEILDKDDARIASGQGSMLGKNRSGFSARLTRAKLAEEVDVEARDRIKSSDRGNSQFRKQTMDALKVSRLIASDAINNGAGAGTVVNLEAAAKHLEGVASSMEVTTKKEGEDQRRLLDQAATIRDKANSMKGSSGVFSEETTSISAAISATNSKILELKNFKGTQAKGGTGDDPFIDGEIANQVKLLEKLSEAARALEDGRQKDAVSILNGTSYKDIAKSVAGKTASDADKSFVDATGKNTRDNMGITDWSAVLGKSSNGIIDSNTVLNKSIENLGTEIKALSAVMERESKIAALSLEANGIIGQQGDKNIELNKLTADIGRRLPLNLDQKRDVQSYMGNPDILNLLGKDSRGDSYKDAKNDSNLDLLAGVKETGSFNPSAKRYDPNYTPTEEDRIKVNTAMDEVIRFYNTMGLIQKEEAAKMYKQKVIQPLERDYYGKPATDEEKEKQNRLTEELQNLDTTLKNINKNLQEQRDAGSKDGASKNTSQASLDISFQGLPAELNGLSEELRSVVTTWIDNRINMYDKNRNLFNSGAPNIANV